MPHPTALPPYRHATVRSGVAVHVAELPGPGQPLLLLHGIGMDWRVWQAVSRRLHPHFHLYCIDLRGHGRSGKPGHGYTLAHYAADVEDVIDTLRLTGVALAGSSLGAMVAAVVEAPVDVVSHRIFIDPPLTGGPLRDPEMLADVLRLKRGDPSALAAYLGRHNPGAGSFYLRTIAEMWGQTADGVITEPLAHAQDYFTIDSHLRAVDSPVLILQADPARGGVLTDEQAERALALLPYGTLVTIPGAGHAIHATKPREFVEELRRFTGQ